MKQILKYSIVIVTIVLLSGCTKQPTEKLPNQVYTQVGMWYLNKEIEICTNKDSKPQINPTKHPSKTP